MFEPICEPTRELTCLDRSSGVIEALDAAHAVVSRAQRELLSLIAEVDRREGWRDSGARDSAHWLAMRYGISGWKARRWITAAYALEGLPRLSDVFERGELGIDKVVELARFATPDTERHLIRWANDVSCATIRHRGDLAARASVDEIVDVDRARSLSWWYFDEGRRFGLGDRGSGDRACGGGDPCHAGRGRRVLRIGSPRRRARGVVLHEDRPGRRP